MPFYVSARVLLHSVNIDSVTVFKAVVFCLGPEIVGGLAGGVIGDCRRCWLELGSLEKSGADVRDLPPSETSVEIGDQVGSCCVLPNVVGSA